MYLEEKGKKMYKTLAVSFLVVLYSAISDAYPNAMRPLYCYACADLKPDGRCARKPGTCLAKRNELCYNRMVSWHYEIMLVDRGCTSKCQQILEDANYRNFTYCCPTPHCNNVNIWEYGKVKV